MSENEIARQGPFVVLEGGINNDYILTDENESVHIGFDEEEAADLEILGERLHE